MWKDEMNLSLLALIFATQTVSASNSSGFSNPKIHANKSNTSHLDGDVETNENSVIKARESREKGSAFNNFNSTILREIVSYLPEATTEFNTLNKESHYTFSRDYPFYEQVATKFNIPELREAERSDDLFVFVQLGDNRDPIWIFRVLANHLFVKGTFTYNDKAIARYLSRTFQEFTPEDQRRANHFRTITESFPYALKIFCLQKNYADIHVPVVSLNPSEINDPVFNIVISEIPKDPHNFIIFAMERKYSHEQIAELLKDYGSEFLVVLVEYLIKVEFATEDFEELHRWNMELVEVLLGTFDSGTEQEHINLYKELVNVRFGRTVSVYIDEMFSNNYRNSRLIFDIAVLGKRSEIVRRILQNKYIEYSAYSQSIPLLFCNLFDILSTYEFFNLPTQYLRHFFRYHSRKIFEELTIRNIRLLSQYGEPTETLFLTASTSEKLQKMGAPGHLTLEFDQRLLYEPYLPNRLYFLMQNIVPESREHAGKLLEDIIKVINEKYNNQWQRILDHRTWVSYPFLEALVNSKDLRESAQKVGLKFEADSRQTVKLLDFDLTQIGPLIEFDLDHATLLHIRSDKGFRNFEAVSKRSIRKLLEDNNLGRTIEAREALTFMLTGSRRTAYNKPMELPLTNVTPREARFYDSVCR